MLFKVLEFCELGSVKDSEKTWMDALDCHFELNGFNIHPSPWGNAGVSHSEQTKDKISKLALKRFASDDTDWTTSYIFISPSGSAFSGKNIANFCRENGMSRKDEAPMCAVLNGNKPSHKGWTAPNGRSKIPYRVKEFRLESPSGAIVCGENLEKFCRDNNLSMWAMGNVVRGRQKESNGWRLPVGSTPRNKHTKIIRTLLSPSGEAVFFDSVTRFSRENGLCIVSVYKVFSGVLKHHKGWRKNPCL